MKTTAALEDILRVIYTEHHDPYTVLGIHLVSVGKATSVAVRAFLPNAASVAVQRTDETAKEHEYPMFVVHEDGFFEYVFDEEQVFPYRLKQVDHDGNASVFHDPYAFLPQLTDYDLYLFGEGNHYKVHERLGSRVISIDGTDGVEFSVWAPGARSVSVIGSFNDWDRRRHAMRALNDSGVWEIFIPDVDAGALYKFEIKTRQGYILDKTDPFARAMEVRPRTASVVVRSSAHVWQDADWMKARARQDIHAKPLAIYEVHLGSWKRKGNDAKEHLSYVELANELAPYVADLGFTHVELMPVMEYPYDGSWGYQVTGYYAPTSRFGTPDDFRAFVDIMHRHNIGVILDWVPAHFPKDMHALARFNGYPLYEHGDPRKGEHMDWGTYIFDFGKSQVRNFLIANALYWLEEFHIDGLRIDAVASMLYLDYSRKEGEWIPNRYGGRDNLEAIDFLRQLNWAVHTYQPGAFIVAEESTAFPGVTHAQDANGLGFDFKWNMGWMNDLLEYFQMDPFFRRDHHDKLTFGLTYAFSEKFLLPISHDEVVHGKRSLISKMFGDYWQQFAGIRLFLGFMWMHPGKKLLFMGQEFGQWIEWNHDAQLDWALLLYDAHRQLRDWVRDLNALYRSNPSMHEVDYSWEGFRWIDLHDAQRSLLSFERISADGTQRLICVCNFTPVVYEGYRLGVPQSGAYREILNSDDFRYGGSGVVNSDDLHTEETPMHDREQSIVTRIPPLGISVLSIKAQ